MTTANAVTDGAGNASFLADLSNYNTSMKEFHNEKIKSRSAPWDVVKESRLDMLQYDGNSLVAIGAGQLLRDEKLAINTNIKLYKKRRQSYWAFIVDSSKFSIVAYGSGMVRRIPTKQLVSWMKGEK